MPEDKITITQNGIDFSKFHSGEKKESIKIIYDKYGFKDFILSVGHLEPRKNHINLIKAYHILRERNLNLPHMVFIGQKSHLYTDIFFKVNNLFFHFHYYKRVLNHIKIQHLQFY